MFMGEMEEAVGVVLTIVLKGSFRIICITLVEYSRNSFRNLHKMTAGLKMLLLSYKLFNK